MQPGSVRAIEYEIVPNIQAARNRLTGDRVRKDLHTMSQLGVLRCVDHQGKKLTVVGDAKEVRRLLANGQAGSPDGMSLTPQVFPVVLAGWKRFG